MNIEEAMAAAKAHFQAGQLDEAEVGYRAILAEQPGYAMAHFQLGNVHRRAGRNDQAAAEFEQAILANPNFAEALNNLALLLLSQGHAERAAEMLHKALQTHPDQPELLNNLANALADQALVEEAIECLDRAAVAHQLPGLYSNRLFMMWFSPRRTAQAILREHGRWNDVFGRPLTSAALPHANDRNPDRRLRIGYVSADFCRHVVAWNFLPLISRHDHARFEIFCYSTSPWRDVITERLASHADHWRDIAEVDDNHAAEMIRADQIDILVDLGLHSNGNRMLLFARKPAPVQATFMGYPATTGVAAIDYRLTDPYLDPPGQYDADYSEQSIRLPDTFWCYNPAGGPNDPLPHQLEANALPALTAGHITFGCLNTNRKVSDAALALWAKILKAMPTSRMLILAQPGSARQRILDQLKSHGIDAARIEFVDRRLRADYLKIYHRIDLVLDTIPYNGHSTSLDGYWMGVPTITRTGDTVVSRAGFSQLSNLGLSELSADSDEKFVQIATELTGDLPRLSALRAGLRQRMMRSPLMDASKFARGIEAAYRQMWKKWCQPMPIDDAMQTAAEHHDAGRLPDAEALYRQILQRDPDHPDALHYLGLLCFQLGRNAEAIELLDRAAALDPSYLDVQSLRARVLTAMSQKSDAISAWQRVLSLNPDDAAARTALGTLLAHQGRSDAAITELRAAVRLNPADASAWHNLAVLLFDSHQLDEAAAACRRAIGIQADRAGTWNTLGSVLRSQGDKENAADAFRRAVALQPDYAEAFCNLAMSLRELNRPDEAFEAASRAAALRPDYGPAQAALATLLNDRGETEAAMAACRRAIDLNPARPEEQNNLAILLCELGRADESIELCEKIVAAHPKFADAWKSLGNALRERDRFEESIIAYRKALALQPRHADARSSLAHVLLSQGQVKEAVECYDQALSIRPDPGVASNRIFALLRDDRADAQSIQSACREWDSRYAAELSKNIRPHENDRSPDRPLRIGYVSPDLRRHVVGWNFVPLIDNHDRDQFKIFCYSATRQRDDLTDRFAARASAWRDIVGHSHDQAAHMIREDRIDILVDLALHTAGNRLLVFARKPAPIQATFMGYPGTTGLAAIDFRLTDPYLDPPGRHDSDYTEQSIRLPRTFWCFDPTADAALADLAPNELPALTAGFITFGCLNDLAKVSDPTLSLWAKVLKAVSTSRLFLLASPGPGRMRVLDRLAAAGIDQNRIEFSERRPRREYLKLFHRIDLALDTIPYNGHTTGVDGCWMGVPTLTLPGNTVASRAGFSQLSNLGLSDLAADGDEQFVHIAASLAGDFPRLGAIRAGLRKRMEQSPLMDGKAFARGIEAAYRQMWQRWCRP